MGEVFAAFDEQLDREVAIKVLGHAEDGELRRKRFLREARLAAKIAHPNIASIHEIGENGDQLYIVMELLEGKTLRRVLSQRRFAIEETLAIGRDIARALDRAHAAGIIHRDIKPENIFVTNPSPDTMLAKVLDFGLARRPDAPTAEESTKLTAPGEAYGTAGYMAPEQIHALDVDARADVFALGCVLYEMLAGRRAFDDSDASARMIAVMRGKYTPLAEVASWVEPELVALVERCIANKPADRPRDGGAVLKALDGVVRASRPSLEAQPSVGGVVLRRDEEKEEENLDSTVAEGGPPVLLSEQHLSTSDILVEPEVRAAAAVIETPMPTPLQGPRTWPFVVGIAAFGLAGLLLTVLALTRSPAALTADRPKPIVFAAVVPVAPAEPPAEKTEEPVDPEPAPNDPAPAKKPKPKPAPSIAATPAKPTTGTLRITQSVPVVVVDGEYRHVNGGTVIVTCGRHRIKVGMTERVVDVPCGGTFTP